MAQDAPGLDLEATEPEAPRRRINTAFFVELSRSGKAMFGIAIVSIIVLSAIFSPYLAPYDPDLQLLSARLLPPLATTDQGTFHLLGTDRLGRDTLSRLIYGARISLIVGVGASLVAGTIGVILGLVSGYFGRWVDDVIMRLCDVQLALPYILLAIAILAIVGSGLFNIIVVLSVTQWVTYARVVRSGVLAEKEREYVLAAKALGFGSLKIIFRYILPNVFAPVIVIATFSIAQTIIAESALSFLGLGMPASIPTWGRMLAEGRTYIVVAWWLAAIPGLVITITVIGVNLLGDWLRDYLDPRLKL
jgi:peptide/nickel transport system permease protein